MQLPANFVRLGLLAGLMLAAVCTPSGPRIVDVAGTLTRNGKPVPGLEVYFMPDQGRPSVGMADSQGRFKLGYTHDQDGAITGSHTVFVVFNPRQTGAERVAAPAELRPILEKYGTKDVSPLRIEVTKPVSDLEIKLD
jgi:hypothetical protein